MKEQEKNAALGEKDGPEGSPEGSPEGLPKSPKTADSPTDRSGRSERSEQFVRLAADFENYKRRTQKEFSDQRILGKRELLEKLLVLSDTFELAMNSVKDAKPDVLKGLLMIKSQLNDILKGEGAEKFGNSGEVFDPHRHEALEFVPGTVESDGKIESVIQCGYCLPGGKLLRHATVRVFKCESARSPEKEPSLKEGKTGQEGPA